MSYWKYDISGPGCAAICIVIVGLCFLEAWIFQLLWNWIVPVFWTTAPILTYWQAFGACVLISMIGSAFKSTNVNK